MNTLFIGLGGVGCGTLESLYKRMNEYNRHLQANQRPQVSAEYIYIDTDGGLNNDHPEEFISGTHKTWLSLSSKSPDQLKKGFQNMGDNTWEQWYDAGSNPYALTMGADAKRQYSRLAFKDASTTIRTALYPHIQDIQENNGRVYVITGSCGGTGCGIYMDVLYMIAEIFSDLQTPEVATDVRLIMAMPQGYLDKDNENYNVKKHQGLLNAFATLSELNAMCLQKDNLLFNNCYVGSPKMIDGAFRPFHFGYMYDSAGLSRDEVCQRVSDYLFEIELAGNNLNRVAIQGQYNGSDFDRQMTNEVNAVWGNSINTNYVRAFCSLGQFSIEKPDELYRQYFADRLLYDVVMDGLVGRRENVDQHLVGQLKTELTNAITEKINHWAESISKSITKNDFSEEDKFHNAFTVFTAYANKEVALVNGVINQKDSFLKDVEDLIYTKCRDWLKTHDFNTVYSVLDAADVDYYQNVENGFVNFSEKVFNAKHGSYGGITGKSLKSEKAEEQFKLLLKTWLKIRVEKALSSGPGDDIKDKDKGFLDICKSFIEKAIQSFDLTGIRGWKTDFKKRVAELKLKNDRRYIPDLSTITDVNNEIIEDGEMIVTYNQILKQNGESATLATGTCTPLLLHEQVVRDIENDIQLAKRMKIDDLFNPDMLATTNSLRQGYKAKAFFEVYQEKLKNEIDELIRNNQDVNNLFTSDIVTRLNGCDPKEQASICLAFKNYNETQFKTISLGAGANQVYTFSYSHFNGDTAIMQKLGIKDANGQTPQCTANNDDEFFQDKIVKLIVKTGFSIENYRYFDDYRRYANKEMKSGLTHDPFIDKRFLGEPDKDGKYPCNVSEALNKIAEDAQAAQQAEEHSLDGCGDVEVYQYCLALLYQYFKSLQDGNKIETELIDGITMSGNVISVKDFSYDKSIEEYELGNTSSIDLSILKNLNNMLDLNTWINHLMKKKKAINDEKQLYIEAFKYLKGIGIVVSQELKNAVNTMRGDDSKPVYDFFTAYLDWYNKD